MTRIRGQVPDSGLIKSPIRASQREWGVKKHKSMIYIKPNKYVKQKCYFFIIYPNSVDGRKQGHSLGVAPGISL